MTPGDPAASIDGTRIALNNAGLLILNSKTLSLASGAPFAEPFTIMIANQPVTANPAAVAVAGTTLRPGDPAATIGGTPVALNAAGSLILNSKITADPPLRGILLTTIADQAITANPTAVAIAGTTPRPADPAIMVDGTSLALNTAGPYFLLVSETIPSGTSGSVSSLVTTIAGQTITAAAGGIAIQGMALRKGDEGFEINGTLDTAGRLVVGLKTQIFCSGSVGLGGSTEGVSGLVGFLAGITTSIVESGALNRTDGAATTSMQVFRGGAGGLEWDVGRIVVIMVLVAGSLVLLRIC